MSSIDPRLPPSIHELWAPIQSEVVWLHGRWIIYRQLYGTSAERVDVLNRSAGTFFNVLQIVLLHDVQLSLSKLGDPAQSRAQRNMTLKALAAQLQTDGESAVVLKLMPLLAAFDVSCSKIRRRRNKSIAHFD